MPGTLIFGGSFDPVHHGHLVTALRACEELGTRRVLFIPAAVSPHKMHRAGGSIANGEDRLAMLRLSTSPVAHFAVSDLELRRSPPSYTIDTVRALVAAEPAEEFTLLIGADQLPKLHTWREIDALLGLVNIAVLGRPGSALDLAGGVGGALQKFLPRMKVLSTPLLEISATDVRARVAAGKLIDYLVPEAVAAYIREKCLYRAVH